MTRNDSPKTCRFLCDLCEDVAEGNSKPPPQPLAQRPDSGHTAAAPR